MIGQLIIKTLLLKNEHYPRFGPEYFRYAYLVSGLQCMVTEADPVSPSCVSIAPHLLFALIEAEDAFVEVRGKYCTQPLDDMLYYVLQTPLGGSVQAWNKCATTHIITRIWNGMLYVDQICNYKPPKAWVVQLFLDAITCYALSSIACHASYTPGIRRLLL